MFFPFLYHIVSTQKMCSGILSPGRLEFHLLIPLLIPTLSFRGPLSHLSFATPSKELPWWLSGKESTCQCRRCGFDPWLRKIPWKKKGQLTPLCLPGKSHGQRSLVGYSPWVCKRVERYPLTKQQTTTTTPPPTKVLVRSVTLHSSCLPQSAFLENLLLCPLLVLGEAHWLKLPTLARHHSNHLHELFYDRRSW